MLTAYFDDSGTSPSDPVAVVAGYLATDEMWARFNVHWAALLGRYGIKRLHRVDLENYSGEFRDWNSQVRIEFVKKAQAIIRRCTYSGFGLAIVKRDFAEVFPEDNPFRNYGLFGWCAHGCLAGVKMWCDAKRSHEPIQYVFEAGSSGQDQFQKMLKALYRDPVIRRDDRIGGWSFLSKDTVPLQAADVVAYEFFKFVRNSLVDNDIRPIRLSARDLFRTHELQFFRHFDTETLRSFVDRWNRIEPPNDL